MIEFIAIAKQHLGWTVAVGLLLLFGALEVLANIIVRLRKKAKRNADL